MSRLLFWLRMLPARLVAWRNNFRRRYLAATGRLSEYDTMGVYKRLQSQPDDAGPKLRRPDPNAPHAALINRVRLYARNGAKALGPLLDRPLPQVADEREWEAFDTIEEWEAYRERESERVNWDDELFSRYQDAKGGVYATGDAEAATLLEAFICKQADGSLDWNRGAFVAAHSAYNSPWTVKDGEVWEVDA